MSDSVSRGHKIPRPATDRGARRYVFLAALAMMSGLMIGPAVAASTSSLTAAQYTHVEDLYWKVMARCCIRKPGAIKIHQEIERRVSLGEPDSTILADLSRRFGGQPIQIETASSPIGTAWVLGGIASVIALACWWLGRLSERRM